MTIKAKLTATVSQYPKNPLDSLTFDAAFDTKAERDEFLALFPKSLGLKAAGLSRIEGTIGLRPAEGNKANETGIKKVNRLVELLEQHGVKVETVVEAFRESASKNPAYREAYDANLVKLKGAVSPRALAEGLADDAGEPGPKPPKA